MIDRSSQDIPVPVMQNILTDKLLGKMSAIVEHFQNRLPLGPPTSQTIDVTDVPVEVNLGEWVRATLFNNAGSSDVYVYGMRQNADTRDAYLAAGDSLPIDYEERTRTRLYLVCAAGGTAAVRIFYQ